MVVRGLSLPGACGPNLARIASDNWDFLLHCLFDEMRVESELSSCGVQQVGKGPSPGHTSCMLGEGGSAFPGYVTSWLCLEFVR